LFKLNSWLSLYPSFTFLLLASLVALPTVLFGQGQSHTVQVVDHEFIPDEITITEGDTVSWVWGGDNHDVVAGKSPQEAKPEIFDSEFQNEGFVFELTFSREFLNTHPLPGDIYDYFCHPHFHHGMVGKIIVNRLEKPFQAQPAGFQVVPPTSSEAGAECSLVVSADESELEVSCAHDLDQLEGVELRSGIYGQDGDIICNLNPQELPNGTICQISSSQVDQMLLGNTYLVFNTTTFPGGELRGQVLNAGGSNLIEGTVFLQGQGLGGVEVSDGTRSATTDLLGQYTLDGVPNGVYNLTAAGDSYVITPNQGTNPVVVNDQNLTLRDFTATVCEGDVIECSLCEELQVDGLKASAIESFRLLRRFQQRSLRRLNRVSRQANFQQRLSRFRTITRRNRRLINTTYPNSSVRVECSDQQLCLPVQLGDTLQPIENRIERQQRQIRRMGRRARLRGVRIALVRRLNTRTAEVVDGVKQTLSELPQSFYECSE